MFVYLGGTESTVVNGYFIDDAIEPVKVGCGILFCSYPQRSVTCLSA